MTALETIVELAILGLLAWPVVRLLLAPGFIGRLGGSPELAIAICLALGAYLVGVVAVAVLVPVLLRPAAVIAVVLMLAMWWRARPGYGRARGLPPGSLSLAPVGPWVDDQFYRKQAARHGPVFKTNHVVVPTVCIVGLPAGVGLLRENDLVLDTPTPRFSTFIEGGFLRYMTPETHATYWAVMRKGVSGSIIRDAEPDIARIARDGLGRLTSTTATTATTDDIACRILLRLLFGIAPDDPDMDRLVGLYRVIDPRRAWRSTRNGVLAAIEQTEAIIRSHGASGAFGAALADADDDIAEPVLLRNFVVLNHTAGGDLGGLLSWIVRMLTDHPEWVARVRGEERPSGLARRIAQETLRLEQSEFITRRAREDIHWDGFLIPKGWRVRVCVRESHRSPEIFEHPDVFDPDRFLPARPAREDYSPFGVAATRTSCLGEGMSLTVARIFIEELVHGFDWNVVSDGPREFSGFHWRPSRKFRIALAPR